MCFYEVNKLDMALRNYKFADAGPRTRPASSSGRSVEERGVDCTEGSYFQTSFSMFWDIQQMLASHFKSYLCLLSSFMRGPCYPHRF